MSSTSIPDDSAQLSSSTNAVHASFIEEQRKRLEHHSRILLRRHMYMDAKDFCTLFDCGLTQQIVDVLRGGRGKRKRTSHDTRGSKRKPDRDSGDERRGVAEGQSDSSESDSDSDWESNDEEEEEQHQTVDDGDNADRPTVSYQTDLPISVDSSTQTNAIEM